MALLCIRAVLSIVESHLLVRTSWYCELLLLKIIVFVACENEFYDLIKTTVQMFISR